MTFFPERQTRADTGAMNQIKGGKDLEIRELVTHDGKFHADEVMSTVILTDLFPKAGIFRSRDPRMTSAAPGRVVYDVGGAFDPAKGLFDHHQQGSPKREDGTDYSSFGLVWDRFGREWLAAHGVSAEDADAVWLRIDRQIASPIDAADTGAVGPIPPGSCDG